MTQLNRYVVVCCENRIATILDDRPREFVVVPAGPFTISSNRNRRGSTDTTPIRLECESCSSAVDVTTLTVRDVIDRINTNVLPVEEQDGLDSAPWMSDLLAAIGGRNHHVVPFRAMLYAITKLSR